MALSPWATTTTSSRWLLCFVRLFTLCTDLLTDVSSSLTWQLFQTAPSPWAEAGEGLEPHPPPSKPRSPPERNPSRRQLVPASAVVTAPGGGQTSIRVALNTGKPFRPATNAMMPSRGSAGKFLPLMPAPPNVQSPRQVHLNSSATSRSECHHLINNSVVFRTPGFQPKQAAAARTRCVFASECVPVSRRAVERNGELQVQSRSRDACQRANRF